MKDSSRNQGLAILIGAAVTGLVFLKGLWDGDWWAVAIPVGLLLAFVLGLVGWVGYTIATIEVEPEEPPAAPDAAADPGDGAGTG